MFFIIVTTVVQGSHSHLIFLTSMHHEIIYISNTENSSTSAGNSAGFLHDYASFENGKDVG